MRLMTDVASLEDAMGAELCDIGEALHKRQTLLSTVSISSL